MKYLTIIFIIVLPIITFGQPSSKKVVIPSHPPSFKFTPVDTTDILNFKQSCFEIEKLKNYRTYHDSLIYTPYQISEHNKFLSSFDQPIELNNERIGGIERYDILKIDTLGSTKAFIYQSYEFEEFQISEPGIWVAISKDDGNNWEYHYTGLKQKQPLFLKWYSGLPLITENGLIQIEGCRLRQVSPFSLPVGDPEYDIIEDGLLVIFDVHNLKIDSDKDGLSDIIENKLRTNPEKYDTDADGICDKEDLYPIVNQIRTDKTILYEFGLLRLQDETYPYDETSFLTSKQLIWKANKLILKGTEFLDLVEVKNGWPMKTVYIVSDEKDLHGIKPHYLRVICLTENEHESVRGDFNKGLNYCYLSLNQTSRNKYELYLGTAWWGQHYQIRRKNNKWIIKSTISWIT